MKKFNKTNPVSFDVEHIGRNVFLVTIPNEFDLAMTFLRAQEFYESNCAQFKGKSFSVIDYIRWYAHQRSNKFSYPQDWAGFNLPGHALVSAMSSIPKYDGNVYDYAMQDILNRIFDMNTCNRFYVIGISSKSQIYVMDHEIAHALYYLDSSYKRKVNSVLYEEVDTDTINEARINLGTMGYHKSVFTDEIQAYIVSGGTALLGVQLPKVTVSKIRRIYKEHKPCK